MNLMLGLILIYGIPAALAVIFWILVRHLVRLLYARDVMDGFRPDRRRVAAEEQRIDSIYLEVFGA